MAKIITADYALELQYPPFENMTDAEFLHFCEQNKHIPIERDENHQILFMPPVTSEYSGKNSSFNGELYIWNRKYNYGYLFDSSAGFFLPDSSMRSPDAAWVSFERWTALTDENRAGFAHITPDFVAELASPSDRIDQLKIKMEKWRENGVQLGWLIDPATETVLVYRADGTIAKIEGFENSISGEEVLPDFEFDLRLLK